MRSKFFRSLAMALMAAVMLGAPLMSTASAQPPGEGPDDRYVPLIPPVVDCSGVPAPTLGLDGFVTVTTYPEIYLQCVVRIVIDVGGTVLYDGPPTATLIHREPLPPLPPGATTITATATTVDGVDLIATLTLSAEQVNAINALIAAAGGGTFQNPSVPAGDAIPVPGSGSGFALTGSNVNLPIAIGAALVGAGGIAVMFARRREQRVPA